MNGTVNVAGRVNLTTLEIVSLTSGKVIDITTLFMEMNIYESIHTSTIGGFVTINESLDMISHLPIVGEEVLRIGYNTPNFPDKEKIQKTFTIYKIGERMFNEGKSVYTIYFMSVEAYEDTNIKLSRAYNGQLSYIAKQLFETHDGLNSDKDLFLEETDNAFRFVIPMWTPIKTLNYLAARSISKKYHTANYLFYEDLKQFNFRSTSSLIDQNAPYAYYQYNQLLPRNAYEMDRSIDPYSVIRQFQIPTDFDITKRQLHGFYSSKILNFDILTKKLNIKDLDYFNTFTNRPHLDKPGYPISTQGTMRNPNAFVNFYPTNTYMFDDYETDNPLSWVVQRNMTLQEMDLHKIIITVPGRTDMTCGKVVFVDYNAVQAMHDVEDSYENLYTGNYLVSMINHRLSRTEHEMIMTCVKENVIRNLEAK